MIDFNKETGFFGEVEECPKCGTVSYGMASHMAQDGAGYPEERGMMLCASCGHEEIPEDPWDEKWELEFNKWKPFFAK